MPLNPLGPVTNYSYLQGLITIRDNLVQELMNETTYRLSNGPRPTYQLKGRQVQWNEYLAQMKEEIKSFTELIAMEDMFEGLIHGYC